MYRSFVNLACLAVEANLVVGLRLHRISLGGPIAWDESLLMMSEKVQASQGAVLHLASGCSFDSVVTGYRDVVQANVRRLTA